MHMFVILYVNDALHKAKCAVNPNDCGGITLWHGLGDYGLLVFDILLNYPHDNEHVAVSNINLITHKMRA